MAAFDASRAAYTSVSFVGRLGETAYRVFAAVAEWNDARVTRNSLNKLTDRELDDIGLVRGDIEDVAVSQRRF